MTGTQKTAACALVTAMLAAGLGWSARSHFAPAGVAEHQMFANRIVGDPETGRSGPMIDTIHLSDGPMVQYDDQENILVAGKGDPAAAVLLMPGPKDGGLVAGYIDNPKRETTVYLPRWRDSAILFDRKGVLRVIFLKSAKAKDLFRAIELNHREFDRLFGAKAPSVR